jgi:parvulin-like peptidyl-prolyl isomerase
MNQIWISIQRFVSQLKTRVRISWIKHWALQRRFAIDRSSMSLRRALTLFIGAILVIYFVIGLPILGYMIYAKRSGGVPLALASTLYPFPVALVGNDTILLKPFSDRLNYLKFFSKQTQQQLPSETDLRHQVIDKLVDEAVIRQWANKEGITVTNKDIDATYDKIVKDKGNEGDVKTVLSQLYNLNDKEFKRLIPDLLYREKIEEKLLVRFHIRHILVTTEADAKKVKDEANAENFGEKAKQYSQDKTTRDQGGDLGFFDKATAEKISGDFAKLMYDTQPGSIGGPVKTQYGYHVVFVQEKTGKEDKSFEQWLNEKRAKTKIRKFLK